VAGGFVWSAIRRRHTRGRGRADAGPAVDAPLAQLLDLDGRLGRPGAAVELARTRTRIGRDPHNELAFDGVDSMSAEHAVIEYRDGHYWIEDLRSTNGTRLDGEPLVPGRPAQLKGGDRIRLADIELMFVLAGYAPRGETVFLDPTTTPPDASTRAIDDEGIDVPREGTGAVPAAAHAEQPEPARSSQLSLLRREDAEVSAEGPAPGTSGSDDALTRAVDRDDAADEASAPASDGAGEDPAEAGREPTRDACAAIRANLDDHLRRVQALSEAFAAFVARAFEGEIRDAIAVSARDLVAEARDHGRVARKHYTFDHVRFVLCGVPGGVEQARQLFVDSFGGFTRLLSEELHADTFRAERCEILAVLTFGDGEAPWVSLSIVPDEEHDSRIDLLSYELLTEEELREIDLDGPTDLSQSGLG
jgi:pSer/pThr/pTyr-binding forkhead associated (FHA) protein